jgi:hypothetical protein
VLPPDLRLDTEFLSVPGDHLLDGSGCLVRPGCAFGRAWKEREITILNGRGPFFDYSPGKPPWSGLILNDLFRTCGKAEQKKSRKNG